MLRTTRWRGGQQVADDAGHGRARGDVDLVWIDLEGPTDEELHEVATKAVLHPLAVEDLSVPDERPKIEVYGDGTVVIESAAPDLSPLGIVLQPGLVVTVRRPDRAKVEAPWDLGKVEQRFARTCPKKATAGFLLYTLLDEVVDGHLDHLDAMGEQLEDLEDRIFGESLGDEHRVQQDIFALRRALLVVRRRVEPMREVLSTVLRGEVDLVGDELRPAFQDVLDHLLRAIDVVDSQRELLSGAVDAHLAMISNRMNQVMKKMTSWGAILVASTLVAGIYGMNFEHMPELHWRYGYYWSLGLMAAVTGGLYTYFKRRNWL